MIYEVGGEEFSTEVLDQLGIPDRPGYNLYSVSVAELTGLESLQNLDRASFQIYSIDSLGSQSLNSQPLELTVDHDPPNIALVSDNGLISTGSLNFYITDEISGIALVERGELLEPDLYRIPVTNSGVLSFSAFDAAGNVSTYSENVVFDNTAPVLSNNTLDSGLGMEDDLILGGDGAELSLTVDIFEADTGVSKLRYWYVSSDEEILSFDNPGYIEKNNLTQSANAIQTRTVSVPNLNQGTWKLYVSARDYAHNTSPIYLVGQVIISDAVKDFGSRLTGGVDYKGIRWYSDPSSMSISYQEEPSDSYQIEYSIDSQTWSTDLLSLLSSNYSGSVNLLQRIQSTAGATRIFDLGKIQKDTTGPIISLQGIGLESAFPGGFIDINYSAQDENLTVDRVRYQLKDASSVIQEGALSSDGRVYLHPNLQSGNYTIVLTAWDLLSNPGNSITSASFDIEYSETLSFSHPKWVSPESNLLVQWFYGGSIEIDHYIVNIQRDGVTVESLSQSSNILNYELPINDLRSIRIKVEAYNSLGELVVENLSGIIGLDNTAPEFIELSTDSNSGFIAPGPLRLTWSIREEQSDLKNIKFILEQGVFDDNGQLEKWNTFSTQSQLSPQETGSTSLYIPQLFDGDLVRITVGAENEAGLVSSKIAGTYVFDGTPPQSPSVFVGISAIRPEQTILPVSWGYEGSDPISGITSQKYRLGYTEQVGQEILWTSWTEIEKDLRSKEFDLESLGLIHGQQLFVQIMWTNGSGLSSIDVSDSMTIDNTAPYLSKIELSGHLPGYLASLNDPLSVKVYADEEETEVSLVSSQLGKIVSGAFIPLSEVKERPQPEPFSDAAGMYFVVQDSFNVPADTPLVFRGDARNLTGLSSTGYSGVYYIDSIKPELQFVAGQLVLESEDSGYLDFIWSLKSTSAQAQDYHFNLYEVLSVSSSGVEQRLISNPNTERIDVNQLRITGLDQGKLYRLQVIPVGRSGNGLAKYSNIVGVDYTAPDISLTAQEYIFNAFIGSGEIVDNETGLAAVNWSIGTAFDPNFFTQTFYSTSEDLQHSFDLDILSPLVRNSLYDKDTAIFYVSAQNQAGLWSKQRISPVMRADFTPPEVTASRDSIWETSTYGIYGIKIESTDHESRIRGYQWFISESDEASFPSTGIQELTYGLDESGLLLLDGSSAVPGSLVHGREYYVYLRVYNTAGNHTEIIPLGPITSDQIGPVITLSDSPYNGLDTEGYFVENDETLEVQFSLDEYAQVNYFVEISGTTYSKTSGFLEAETDHSFSWEETLEPDRYLFKIQATDEAGNVSEVPVQIRINEGPKLQWINGYAENEDWILPTTPGKPMIWNQQFLLEDPESDGPMGLTVEYGDGESWSVTDIAPITPIHNPLGIRSYSHDDTQWPFTDYLLQVSATDSFGKTSNYESIIQVRNTTIGPLYENEKWTGVHQLTGLVTVGDTLTLELDSGTRIIAGGLLHAGIRSAGLEILSGANLTTKANNPGTISFSIHSDLVGQFWQGVMNFGGNVFLDNVEINDGYRGFTHESGTSSLTDLLLMKNLLGMHYLSGDLIAENLRIQQNIRYGLKMEDEIIDVDGMDISDNGRNVYDNIITVRKGEN